MELIELKEWLALPLQEGRMTIYSPREKTSRLGEVRTTQTNSKFDGADSPAGWSGVILLSIILAQLFFNFYSNCKLKFLKYNIVR
jgi:hypothetical protein